MSRKFFGVRLPGILFFAILAAVPLSRADEGVEDEKGHVVKNYRGLQFKVPEDWPIEKVGNAIGPIPIEDYMSRKFAELTERIKKQEETMAAMEKRLAGVERRRSLNA